MKSIKNFAAFATTLLCFAALASPSFAATTNPLNEPNGLALDASGNLYVANTGTNSILVFNPAHEQLKARTITASVHHPTAVAVDPIGRVWVANYTEGAGSITEYAGVAQVTNGTITEGVTSPLELAVDGLGSIWVLNAGSYVDVYSQPDLMSPNFPSFLQTFNEAGPLYTLAVQEDTVALSSATYGVGFASALATINNGSSNFVADTTLDYVAQTMAGDGNGNFYLGTVGGTVVIVPSGETFAVLDFVPAGMAIDKVHGLIYFSNFSANEILVYSLSKKELLTTIK